MSDSYLNSRTIVLAMGFCYCAILDVFNSVVLHSPPYARGLKTNENGVERASIGSDDLGYIRCVKD